MACYLAAFVKLNQIQVLEASEYNDRPENTRAQLRDFNRPRGDIVSVDGEILAYSEPQRADLRFERKYPLGDLFGHVTGYYSFRLGSTGVERTYNAELTGRTSTLQLRELTGLFREDTFQADVHLTLHTAVQRVAQERLDGLTGSVVALDPRTGGILAMYSNPTYDPEQISSNDLDTAEDVKTLLDASPDKPLLARTYQERFFPGSTFKVVTAAAGLESGSVDEDRPSYDVVRSYTPPQTVRPISNFDGALCGGTLFPILERSCNSSFAQMAVEQIGRDGMVETAEAVGFNDVPPIDLTRPAESVFPTDFGDIVRRPEGRPPIYSDSPTLAQAAIGQNDVSATPLQMALVAAAVANEGRIMVPHVMAEIRASGDETVERFDQRPWRDAMTPEVAAVLRRAMVSVVENGTASSVQLDGWEVGAKTGTAQLGTTPPRSHAWMIAFAGPPGEAPSVAVAVMVQGVRGDDGLTGGRVAGPIANAVLQAALVVN